MKLTTLLARSSSIEDGMVHLVGAGESVIKTGRLEPMCVAMFFDCSKEDSGKTLKVVLRLLTDKGHQVSFAFGGAEHAYEIVSEVTMPKQKSFVPGQVDYIWVDTWRPLELDPGVYKMETSIEGEPMSELIFTVV